VAAAAVARGGRLGVRRGPVGFARRGVTGVVARGASAGTSADPEPPFFGAPTGAAVARGDVLGRSGVVRGWAMEIRIAAAL
jgi:hypothetical protein